MSATAIIPSIIYKDAKTAIEWLVNAFGFKKQLNIPGPNNQVVHSELVLGFVMVMIGSSESGSEFSKLVKTPSDFGGFETQSPYIVVDNPDELYQSAKANGAKILIDIKTEDFGGRGFTCADPEGHIWSFGSYDPWKTVH